MPNGTDDFFCSYPAFLVVTLGMKSRLSFPKIGPRIKSYCSYLAMFPVDLNCLLPELGTKVDPCAVYTKSSCLCSLVKCKSSTGISMSLSMSRLSSQLAAPPVLTTYFRRSSRRLASILASLSRDRRPLSITLRLIYRNRSISSILNWMCEYLISSCVSTLVRGRISINKLLARASCYSTARVIV